MNYILHRLIASHIKLAEPPTTRSPVATVKLECAYTNRHAIHAHVSGFLALYCAAINRSLFYNLHLQRRNANHVIDDFFLLYRLLFTGIRPFLDQN